MYQYNLLGSIIQFTNGGCYLFFDFFFHFQKKYKPTPNMIYTPMNIYIGFTLSPKRYAMKRLVAVLIYFKNQSINKINIMRNIPIILFLRDDVFGDPREETVPCE